MSSVAAVGDLLGRLHATRSPDLARALIEGDLATAVSAPLPAEDALVLLLDASAGLLRFVAESGGGERRDEAPRKAALALLEDVVSRAAPADVARYAAVLRDACAALALGDGDNEVKVAALKLLAAALARAPPGDASLRVGELSSSLRVWLFHNSGATKSPAGVRAAML